MSSEMLGQQALPRVGHRLVKRATIAAVILLALCLFLVGLDCLVAGPTGGCAVIVGQAAIVTSAFLVSVVVQMLGNSRVRPGEWASLRTTLCRRVPSVSPTRRCPLRLGASFLIPT